MSDSNSSARETFVYLDFNGKIDAHVLKKQFFFCMANLHKSNPLVQVNDFLFKGTYEYAVGTNLFFDTEDNSEVGDAFHKTTPIRAKMLLKQTRVLNLKPVKVCPKKIDIEPEVKNITFSFNWDYKTLLDKLEDGTLRLQDIKITAESQQNDKSTESESTNKTEIEKDDEKPMEDVEKDKDVIESPQNEEVEASGVTAIEVIDIPDKSQEEREFQNKKKIQMLETSYQRLKVLAGRPTRRIQEIELIEECDCKYKEAYQYHNIERQILQPCDAFKTEPVAKIDEETLSDCVDIARSVFYSILPPSTDFPRKLTPEERNKVLRLDNFDNLSLSARYCVIKEEVELLEETIAKMSDCDSTQKDEFDRTPKETLEIYRKLEDTLRRRIEEIKYSNLN